MKISMTMTLLSLILTFGSLTAYTQTASISKTKNEKSMKTMNTYVIEREIPNAGNLTAADLRGIAQKSCSVLKELGPDIEWVQSYVTDNKIFCIYKAENEELVRRHAKLAGFTCNSVEEVATVISPKTAE